MQLTYRGVSFNALIAGSPAVETTETATFLGKHYAIKSGHVAARQPAEELTYRGIRYSR